MSPDLAIRAQINLRMKANSRPALGISDWCQLFLAPNAARQTSAFRCSASGTSDTRRVLCFVYQRFSQYSGLDFSRVRPEDRLDHDLHFALVCWFDWTITFCEEFFEQFDLDLSDRFDEDEFNTIGELVMFLIDQVNGQCRSSSGAIAAAD
ncbi:hypothetical protein [cf. Phormidesmis sp. LEGE 11477]|uniref:hypothetical protein n=1 Tax=cf. Phormidesmis sp. LEGE 11477 TaxID=1828680 RepID=UPI00187DF98F|nr:hypothetical protein [cf. Phormidesmis sp. LEGE 11477]MBE9062839.1 hypothetical protein [cf. Phormidesmis sp. LEGE 11477]